MGDSEADAKRYGPLDEYCWNDVEEGTPLVGNLEAWLLARKNLHATVSEAAAHFSVPVARIEEIAQDHPWMGIDQALGEPTVFLDGE